MLWYPPKEVVEGATVTKYIERMGFKDYKEFVAWSTGEGYKEFWWKLPQWLGVEWFKEPKELVDLSKGPEWAKWYIGGQLNLGFNVVDKPAKSFPDKRAFIWLGEDGKVVELTYSQLKDEVAKFGGYLREIGIKKGDVVAIYAPMMPESVIAMLGAIRIGAIATPIFSGFAPPAVAERLRLGEAKVLVTIDGYYRRGKAVKLSENARKAIEQSKCSCEVITIERLGEGIEGTTPFHEAKGNKVEPEEVESEDPALLLFTSGTTGKPKGAVISHVGALLQPAKEHYFNLDIKSYWEEKREDLLWWITDIGWMMGPWQVIGSQFLGQTHLMMEGAIDYPKDRVWKTIEKYKVTHFGFAATAARLLKKITSREDLERYDLESLRAFGNTGEPIDPATWIWIMKDVGRERRPFINLSGGTEIFGCFVLPSPVVPLKPSTLWGPGLGMDVDVVDDNGRSVKEQPGYLVAKKPAPSMTRGLWKDPQRYIETYWSRFPGWWFHGDLAYIDKDGFWFILGRADDVIKVAGKRIGPAEIEAIINSHPKVAESACVGIPHELKGEVIGCFVVLKPNVKGDEHLKEELKDMVAKRLGKPFKPEYIIFVSELPKTRSGKIMRRIIRAMVRNMPLGDLSTLENPESVKEIEQKIKEIL